MIEPITILQAIFCPCFQKCLIMILRIWYNHTGCIKLIYCESGKQEIWGWELTVRTLKWGNVYKSMRNLHVDLFLSNKAIIQPVENTLIMKFYPTYCSDFYLLFVLEGGFFKYLVWILASSPYFIYVYCMQVILLL